MEGSSGLDRVVNESSPPPSPPLTVAAVARRLGVAPPTLRTWDRRYGLGPSAHTAGAHRRYSPADVARLMVMRRLTLEGVAPVDAAKIALATPLSPDGRPMHTPAEGYDLSAVESEWIGNGASRPDSAHERARSAEAIATSDDLLPDFVAGQVTPVDPSGTEVEFEPAPPESVGSAVADELAALAELDLLPEAEPAGIDPQWPGTLRSVETERGGAAGGGRIVALPDGTPQSRGLARAAMSLDTYEMHRILREAIRRQGTILTWNTMIMPVLRALGERTRVSGDGIDVEHAFSESILSVLRGVAVSTPQPRTAPTILLACADADYHSLPLHALAAALAERQVPTRMLGSGLPPHALAAAVRRTGPRVIVLFARMPGADAGDSESLRRQRPTPSVILAGPGWSPDTIPATARTAASLIEAVEEVLRSI
jgi:transposase-like protein